MTHQSAFQTDGGINPMDLRMNACVTITTSQ
jgi:hypothetical protein